MYIDMNMHVGINEVTENYVMNLAKYVHMFIYIYMYINMYMYIYGHAHGQA